MVDAAPTDWLQGGALGAVLRAVRKHRRLSQAKAAAEIGISRRTYVDLESGVGRMTLEQLGAFAAATNSDHVALVVAVMFNKPHFAVRCADNKLMTVMAMAAEDFEAVVGEGLADVRPQEILRIQKDAFEHLAKEVEQRRAAQAKLAERLKPPPPDEGD